MRHELELPDVRWWGGVLGRPLLHLPRHRPWTAARAAGAPGVRPRPFAPWPGLGPCLQSTVACGMHMSRRRTSVTFLRQCAASLSSNVCVLLALAFVAGV
jgi:hypothetical protein